jgi:hypothetical protein
MAITGGHVITLTAASDEIRMILDIKRVRWVAGPSSESGDRCIIVDPLTPANILLEFVSIGADYAETYDIKKKWINGLRIGMLDRGTVYVYLN